MDSRASSYEPLPSKEEESRIEPENLGIDLVGLIPLEAQMMVLSYLSPQELVLCATINTLYYYLVDQPDHWVGFLNPSPELAPGGPNYQNARHLFFTQVHLRQRSYSFTALGRFTTPQLKNLLNNSNALRVLVTSKYAGNKMQALINLNSEAVKDLIINKKLHLDEAVRLHPEAVTILGYDWIRKLCLKGEEEVKLAMALTTFPKWQIYAEETQKNITNPHIDQLRRSGHLSLHDAVNLEPQGFLNLQNETLREAFKGGLIGYTELNTSSLNELLKVNRKQQNNVAAPANPPSKSCCRIT